MFHSHCAWKISANRCVQIPDWVAHNLSPLSFRMCPSELQHLIVRHNMARTAVGVTLGVGGLVFWWLSFWVWRVLFLMLAILWGYFDSWDTSFYVAAGGTLLLAIEGVRYRREMVGLEDYRTSIYCDNPLTDTSTGAAMNIYLGDPMGIAYLVSQILFCAPRTTVQAIKNLRGLVRAKPATIEAAATIHNRLSEERRWMPIAMFPNSGAALCLLDQLSLIWTECKGDEVLVRIPAGSEP